MKTFRRIVIVKMAIILSLAFSVPMKAQITFNEIPNGVHRTSTTFTIKANGTDLPVVNGLYKVDGKPSLQYLHYDYTTFSAPNGKVTVRLKYKDPITSIKVSPLKLNIPLTKIDSYTYEFDIPEPVGDEQYYTMAQVNGDRIVIARDPQETDVPTIGATGVFNVKDFLNSLDATQQTNTKAVGIAFQNAVDVASSYGTANGKQGVVYVPKGLYYMGNLMLKSNIALYMAPGAVIRFSDNPNDYNFDYHKKSLNRDGTWWIYTEDQSENIKIYGRGTFDGNGHFHQKDRPSGVTPFANHIFLIMGTKNFVFDGPIIKESAFWGTVLARSKDVTFRNVKLLNSMDANENDGIDVCESQNVLVEKAIGIALDDPFSTKTWEQDTDICPKWYGSPQKLDNVTFKNCVSLTYCGAFKCGHGAMQHQSNIFVINGVVIDCGRAIGIEPKYGNPNMLAEGGFSNITFDNIDIEGAGGEGWLKILADREFVGTPPLKGVVIKNVNIRGKGSPSILRGYDENNMVEDIKFENIRLYGNNKPVTNLNELNILNRGFYKDVNFIGATERETTYRIEAEYANTLQNINIAQNTDSQQSDGSEVNSLNNGDYAIYRGVDFGSNTSNIKLRMLASREFTIEFWIDRTVGNNGTLLDGQLIHSADILANNGWGDVNIPIEGLNGTHDLFIVFKTATAYPSNIGSFNWFELTRVFNDIVGFVFEKPTIELMTGKSEKINPIFTPTDAYIKDLIWSVESESTPDVISIDENGKIKAINAGTATVKAVSVFNRALSATCTVTVIENNNRDTLLVSAADVDILYGKNYQGNTGIRLSGEKLSSIWQDNYAIFNDVDFGDYAGSVSIRYCVPRESWVEVWIDRTILADGSLSGGTLIGTKNIKTDNMSWDRFEEFSIPVDEVSGKHNLCLIFTAYGTTNTNEQFGDIYWLKVNRFFTQEVKSINLPFTEADMYPGETKIVDYTVTPTETANQALIWSIENESESGVVSIHHNVISALKPGTATVKVAYAYKPSTFALLTINVKTFDTSDKLRIEAENFDIRWGKDWTGNSEGLQVSAESTDNKESAVVSSWNGNYLVYNDVDFGTTATNINMRKEVPRGCLMEFWIDRTIGIDGSLKNGTKIGSLEVTNPSSAWGKWYNYDVPISGASGVHNLFVIFYAGGGSSNVQNYGGLNWLELTRNFVALQDIQVTPTAVSLEIGKSQAIEVAFIPIQAYNKDITWELENESEAGVVSLENGVVTALKSGSAKIKISSTFNPSIFKMVDITVLPTSGIEDSSLATHFYPNPVHDQLFISSKNQINKVSVYTIDGKLMDKKTFDGKNSASVMFHTFEAGIYLLQVDTNIGTNTYRIVKE